MSKLYAILTENYIWERYPNNWFFQAYRNQDYDTWTVKIGYRQGGYGPVEQVTESQEPTDRISPIRDEVQRRTEWKSLSQVS